MEISVVIPTFNPRTDFLARVLGALKCQTLSEDVWELVVVDNGSTPTVASTLATIGGTAPRVIVESQPGLTSARLAAFAATKGAIVVMVDDDNVLAPDYLEKVSGLSRDFPLLGAWSGRVDLEIETGASRVPETWRNYLTERQPARAVWSNDINHHDSTPWGAGLCVRREVAQAYLHASKQNPDLRRLDLQGTQLVYGGDTDIAFQACRMGLGKGVFPDLVVRHLISAARCCRENLLRSAAGHAYSDYLHHWLYHRQLPPAKAAWRRSAEHVRGWFKTRDERDHAAAREAGYARARREFTPATK